MKTIKKIWMGLSFGLMMLLALVILQSHHSYAANRRTNYTAAEIKAATVHFDSAWKLSDRLIVQVYLKFTDGSKVYMNGVGVDGINFTVNDSDKRLLTGGSFCDVPSTASNNLSTLQVFLPLDSDGNLRPGFGGKAKVWTANPEKNSFNVYQKSNSVSCIPQGSLWPTDTKVYDLNAPTDVGLQDAVNKIHNSKFKFTDGYNISVNYAGDNKDYTFYDKNPFDDDPNYAQTDSSPFCHSTDITLDISDISSLNDPSKPVPALMKLSYLGKNSDGNGYSCQDKPDPVQVKIDNSDGAATQLLTWDGSDIKTLQDGTNNFDFKQQPNHKNFYVLDTGDHCGGGWFVQLQKDGDNSGKLWKLANASSDKTIDGFKFTNCQQDTSGNTSGIGSRNVSIAGKIGVAAKGSSDDKTPSGASTDTPCETNAGGWAFSWAACPVLDAASGLTNTLLGMFEDQLSFSVDQLGQPNVAGSGAYNVHKSWAIFRDIALALVVIVMLIMVFSQAISFGPFDAYTVRKLLPKLIAAVILIQLSWFGVEWLINLVNDVSQGIANIMYLPFGGSENMDLWHLLDNAHISEGLLTVLNWSALFVGAALGVAFLFTMLGIALTAILALLAAFITLVFRKILLLLVLIFAPIAILLWILPGTERYYKMWRDNFLKALFMFPLIVALIAAGRIFASVVGNVDSNQFLSLLLIMIGFFGPLFLLPKTFKWGGQAMTMAGNFANTASSKIGERPRKYLGNQQESWSKLREARAAHRYSTPEAYKKNRRARFASIWQKPLDRAKAGDYNPILGLPGSEMRSRQKDSFLARADEYTSTQKKEALARAVRLEERLDESRKLEDGTVGGTKDDMYHDIRRLARGEAALKKYYDYNGKEIDLKEDFIGRGSRNRSIANRAAADRMFVLGSDTNFTHIYAEDARIKASGTAEEKAAWRATLNENKDVVLEKMTDLLKGVPSTADTTAEGISKMHGAGIKSVISKLDFEATDADRAGETPAKADERRATAKKRLTQFLTTYSEALHNDNLRGRMEPGGLRAVKAYVTHDDNARLQILSRGPDGGVGGVHLDKEDGRKVIKGGTTVAADGTVTYSASGDVLLKPLIDADDATGTVTGAAAAGVESLPASLRDLLDADLTVQGDYNPQVRSTPAATLASPTELRVQHEATAAAILPPPATLAAGSPAADMFKVQLQSSPEVVQTLAHSIAYGAPTAEYQAVLKDVKNDALEIMTNPASTPDQISRAQESWNGIASQIQQAYMQRLDAEVAHAVQSGVDPATARQAAMQAPDPVTGRTYADEIRDLNPGGNPDLSRF